MSSVSPSPYGLIVNMNRMIHGCAINNAIVIDQLRGMAEADPTGALSAAINAAHESAKQWTRQALLEEAEIYGENPTAEPVPSPENMQTGAKAEDLSWIEHTPEETIDPDDERKYSYEIVMFDPPGGPVQGIPLDRAEFVSLKKHLAALRPGETPIVKPGARARQTNGPENRIRRNTSPKTNTA